MTLTTSEYCLAIDYSGHSASLALSRLNQGRVGDLVAEIGASSQALETLVPSVHDLLQRFGIDLTDIGQFITTSGPGSFTGLRCAYASLKGFTQVSKVPICTVATDEVRARAWIAMTGFVGDVHVVSRVSKTKAVLTRFSVSERILTREFFDPINLPVVRPLILDSADQNGEGLFFHPCRAGDVAKVFEKCMSKQIALTPNEIAMLEPNYYGDKWVLPNL